MTAIRLFFALIVAILSPPAIAQPSDLQRWGAFGAMDGIEWFSEGQVPQRISIPSWSGEVLVIHHGTVARMKAGLKYADIVQRIEKDATATGFRITYSYEDGRKLAATGKLQPDGSILETFTDFGGVARQNRYVTTGRKAKIVRRTQTNGQWADGIATLKTGITRAEQQAKLDAERRQREELAAAKQRREEREAERLAMIEEEEEARYAAEQAAEDAESQAQRQRNWALMQRGAQDLIDHNRRMDEGSRAMLDNIKRNQERYEAQQRQNQPQPSAQPQRPQQPAYQPPQVAQTRTTAPRSSGTGVGSSSSSPSTGQTSGATGASSNQTRKPPPPASVRPPNLPETKAPKGYWDSNEFVTAPSLSEATATFALFYNNDNIVETLASGCYPNGIGEYSCQRRVRRPLTQNQRGRAE